MITSLRDDYAHGYTPEKEKPHFTSSLHIFIGDLFALVSKTVKVLLLGLLSVLYPAESESISLTNVETTR